MVAKLVIVQGARHSKSTKCRVQTRHSTGEVAAPTKGAEVHHSTQHSTQHPAPRVLGGMVLAQLLVLPPGPPPPYCRLDAGGTLLPVRLSTICDHLLLVLDGAAPVTVWVELNVNGV